MKQILHDGESTLRDKNSKESLKCYCRDIELTLRRF